MNSFDAVVYLALIVAIAFGFRAGLLRSLAIILGYLIAMPIAVWATSLFSPQLDGTLGAPWLQNSLPFFAVFVGGGIVSIVASAMRVANAASCRAARVWR